MGEHAVKNIVRPVRVLRIRIGGEPAIGSEAALPSPPPAKQTPAVGRPWFARRWSLALAGVLLLAIVALAAFLPNVRNQVASRFLAPSGAFSAPHLSIAVLPFKNLSGDAAHDYFAEGITDDLTIELSGLPGAFVIAQKTAATFKGTSLGAREVGRELGVRYLVEGSVQRGADRVRISVQLVDGERNRNLWAERFEFERSALDAIQTQIIGRISRELGRDLIDQESRRALRDHPDNVDSVDLTMHGFSTFNRENSRETMFEARELFKRALALDGRNVDAMAGLAHAHQRIATQFWSETPDAEMELARQTIGTALALNRRHAYANYVQGILLSGFGKVEEADAAFEAVLASNPNFAPAYAFRGNNKIFMGRAEETKPLVENAIARSPRDPGLDIWYYFIGYAELLRGHDAEAVEWLRKSAALNPNYPTAQLWLAVALSLLNRNDEAAAAYASLYRLSPQFNPTAFVERIRRRSASPVYQSQLARVAVHLQR
jgi:TolB-like protein/Tfp pilus assembly protein PilF